MLPYFYSCGRGVVVAGCLRSQASGPKDLTLKKSYQKGPYIWEEEKDNAGSCGAVSVPSPRSPELSFPEPGLRSSSSAMLWVATDPPYLTQISEAFCALPKQAHSAPSRPSAGILRRCPSPKLVLFSGRKRALWFIVTLKYR